MVAACRQRMPGAGSLLYSITYHSQATAVFVCSTTTCSSPTSVSAVAKTCQAQYRRSTRRCPRPTLGTMRNACSSKSGRSPWKTCSDCSPLCSCLSWGNGWAGDGVTGVRVTPVVLILRSAGLMCKSLAFARYTRLGLGKSFFWGEKAFTFAGTRR